MGSDSLERSREPDTTASFRNRVRYRFDNLLARGTWAVLLWLGAITFVAVLFSSLLLTIFQVTFTSSEDAPWLEDFWQSLLRVIDPGTMAGDIGWGRRLLALMVTIFGLLIAGTLIGLIANGIEQRVEAMRRGRSKVVESGHVVILGASSRLGVVVEQLRISGRGLRRNAIVVLADPDEEGVREEVRETQAGGRRSPVVFRWGDTSRPSDLAMVGVREARAVIVLADEDAEGDAGVVKAVLATGAVLGGFEDIPIIAEVSDLTTAQILVGACGGAVHPVAPLQTVARIAAFALREPGLSQIVEDLLDYRGSALYLRDATDLQSLSFGELVFRFNRTRPIGILRSGGEVMIKPEDEAQLELRDRLIVFADDLEDPLLGAQFAEPHLVAPASRPQLNDEPQLEHLVIVGWNGFGTQLLTQLDQAVLPGSTAKVVYDPALFSREEVLIPEPDVLQVTLAPSDTAAWHLDEEPNADDVTSIAFLGYRRGVTTEDADSRTLLNLMLLRRALETRSGKPPRVIVELLDADDADLAGQIEADDYVVSDAITSRFMTQLAEQPERRQVLLSLASPNGPSVYLIPARDLALSGETRFGEAVARAYSVGLLAVGWRTNGDRGVRLEMNPAISEKRQMGEVDQIVVIG